MKCLIIVAHPDDETIWMGGTILKHKDWDWTILSLCRKDDQDRMPKFMKVCESYEAKGIISDLDDIELKPLPIDHVAEKIISNLTETKYDYIYTHGDNGEYGHIRHKEVHKAVKELISSEILQCKKLLSFSYTLQSENQEQPKIPVPNKEADQYLYLEEDNYNNKVMIVKDIYGFGGNSFEVLSCNKAEAFNIH